MIYAATGHRDCGGTDEQLVAFATAQLRASPAPEYLISGMALGWDMAIAEAALALDIPLWCAIPFWAQPSKWPNTQFARWFAIRKRAARVDYIAPSYSLAAFQSRNEFMVDRCDLLLALWNGKPGGTGNCVQYAKRTKPNLPAQNFWPEWDLHLARSDAKRPLPP